MIQHLGRLYNDLMNIKSLDELRNYIYYNLFSTKKVIKAKYVANLFKGSTFFFIIALMYFYQNFKLQSYFYLILHGSYGFLWVFKSFIFPDPQFEQQMTLVSAIGGVVLLLFYWIIPFNLISENNQEGYNILRITVCSLMYIFGVSLMLISDCHKFFELKYKQKDSYNKTIKTGLFQNCRNPNYFGEMLLYLSFGILSNSYISYGILLFVWSTVFVVNITCKEISFMKKPDWKEYQNQSWILLPKIVPSSSKLSLLVYIIIFGMIYLFKNYFKAFQ